MYRIGYWLFGFAFAVVAILLVASALYYARVWRFYYWLRYQEDEPPEDWDEDFPKYAVLLPPGWLLLPLVPFWGLRALRNATRRLGEMMQLSRLDQQIVQVKINQELRLKGGTAILLSEQYELNSGEASGMQLDVLESRVELVSGELRRSRYHVKIIPVSLLPSEERPETWAIIERRGKRYVIRVPVKDWGREGAFGVNILKSDGSLQSLSAGERPQRLQSGDHILIGMNDYLYIRLPLLALRDGRTGDVLCENVETVEDWRGNVGDVEININKGKVYAPDAYFHQREYCEGNGECSREEVSRYCARLQPGDKIKNPDDDTSNWWFIGYKSYEPF